MTDSESKHTPVSCGCHWDSAGKWFECNHHQEIREGRDTLQNQVGELLSILTQVVTQFGQLSQKLAGPSVEAMNALVDKAQKAVAATEPKEDVGEFVQSRPDKVVQLPERAESKQEEKP